MKQKTLKAFFEGEITAANLAREAKEAGQLEDNTRLDSLTDDLSEDFIVTADHLVALCDAVMDGDLKPSQLQDIAWVLVSSERFLWNLEDDPKDPVNEVIHAWDAPEINYRLIGDTVMKFRRLLRTGENTFDQYDRDDAS